MMSGLIRKARLGLAKYPKLYFLGAVFYNFNRFLAMRLHCFFRGVKYIEPKKGLPPFQSQFGQDCALRHLNLIDANGVFVEVGCNHPVCNSNSHYLEVECNYSGISIDAIDYKVAFSKYRPNTRFVNCLVDSSASELAFYNIDNVEGWENQISSVYERVLISGKGFTAKERKIKCRRLDDICSNLRKIDCLLIDVEGHELSVLDSFDFQRWRPRVILVENNGEFYPRKVMEEYMLAKNYNLLARVGCYDDIYVPMDLLVST